MHCAVPSAASLRTHAAMVKSFGFNAALKGMTTLWPAPLNCALLPVPGLPLRAGLAEVGSTPLAVPLRANRLAAVGFTSPAVPFQLASSKLQPTTGLLTGR